MGTGRGNIPNTMPETKKRKVEQTRIAGMLGCGVVGDAVCAQLQARHPFLEHHGINIKIVKVCVQNVNKKRPHLPAGCQITTDYHEITNDPEIDLVIEVMGGV